MSFDLLNPHFSWLGEMDKHARDANLEVIDFRSGFFRPSLVPLCTNTYLTGHFELIQGIPKLNDRHPSIPSQEETQRMLLRVFWESKKGAVYHWPPVTLLARKPAVRV